MRRIKEPETGVENIFVNIYDLFGDGSASVSRGTAETQQNFKTREVKDRKTTSRTRRTGGRRKNGERSLTHRARGPRRLPHRRAPLHRGGLRHGIRVDIRAIVVPDSVRSWNKAPAGWQRQGAARTKPGNGAHPSSLLHEKSLSRSFALTPPNSLIFLSFRLLPPFCSNPRHAHDRDIPGRLEVYRNII